MLSATRNKDFARIGDSFPPRPCELRFQGLGESADQSAAAKATRTLLGGRRPRGAARNTHHWRGHRLGLEKKHDPWRRAAPVYFSVWQGFETTPGGQECCCGGCLAKCSLAGAWEYAFAWRSAWNVACLELGKGVQFSPQRVFLEGPPLKVHRGKTWARVALRANLFMECALGLTKQLKGC